MNALRVEYATSFEPGEGATPTVGPHADEPCEKRDTDLKARVAAMKKRFPKILARLAE